MLPVLVAGHVAVTVGAVVLAVLLLRDVPAQIEGLGGAALLGGAPVMLGVGLAALVLAQVLSVRRLLGHRRALVVGQHGSARHGTEEGALVTAMRRTGWPVAFAHYPILLGMLSIALLPPAAPLLALFCVLPAASLLLDHVHVAWAHRRIEGRGPRTRLLPPGDGERLRAKLRRTPALLVTSAVAGALLALLSAPWPTGGGGDRFASLLPALAAASTALLSLLLVRPVRQMRGAVRGGGVDLPALDAAARTMRRLGAVGAAGTALVWIAVRTAPTAPLLAAAPTILLVLVLGWLTLHLAWATCTALGAPFPEGGRRAGGSAGPVGSSTPIRASRPPSR